MASGKVKRKKRHNFWQEGKLDTGFLITVLFLLVFGLVMLFSSSYAYAYERYGDSYKFISKQLVFAAIGIVIMLFISKIDYHFLRKFSVLIYIFSLSLLALVLFLPPMSDEVGVKRWINIKFLGFQFQPSEIGKFAIILLFAHLISINQEKMHSFKFLALLGALLLGIAFPVYREPHISATIIILVIGFVLVFVGGMSKIIAILVAGGGSLGAILVLNSNLIGYSSNRIKYWHDPWLDAKGEGFQTIQSLLAIGSGGILGRGFGQSRQKYLWVPEPHNDFIFSIICEELGLVGALLVIAGFAMLIWRGFSIAMRAEDKFGMLLGIGLTFQVGLQAMLNIWVVTNTMPNTGISLPFFSYGGSSLIILLAEMGIILSISRSANKDK